MWTITLLYINFYNIDFRNRVQLYNVNLLPPLVLTILPELSHFIPTLTKPNLCPRVSNLLLLKANYCGIIFQTNNYLFTLSLVTGAHYYWHNSLRTVTLHASTFDHSHNLRQIYYLCAPIIVYLISALVQLFTLSPRESHIWCELLRHYRNK